MFGQTYATVPYFDNFNSMGSQWSTSATYGAGVLEVRNWSGGYPQLDKKKDASNVFTGGNGLAIYNSSVANNKLNASLRVNLANKGGVTLKFSVMDWGSGVNQDSLKIYISTNGGSSFGSKFSLVNLNQSPYDDGVWNNVNVNISNLASTNGLTLTSTTVIKMVINLEGSLNAALTEPKYGSQFVYIDNLYVNFTSTLPVELNIFSVVKKDEVALIYWQTASEINNDYFVVQRSSDGINFEDYIFENGNGNSTSIINYNVIDKTPLNGLNYYRLKQVDYDGTSTYSEIQSVEFNKQTISIQLYPNPSSGNISLLNLPVNSMVKIYNAAGQLIFLKTFNSENIQLDLHDFSQGCYFVNISNALEAIYTAKIDLIN